MNNIKHILYCPFTGLGLHNGYRGDTWFKNRVRIFKEYTLKGLKNQTNKDFTLWISFRMEDSGKAVIEEFINEMRKWSNENKIDLLYSHNGVMFFDDKIDDNSSFFQRLRAEFDRSWFWRGKIDNKEWVYMTIQPSDDVYFKDAVDLIQKVSPGFKKACGFKNGYLLNARNKELAEYNPTTHPPFYTIIFPREVFLDPLKHFNYIGPYKSHEEIPSLFEYVELPQRGFCVLVHGENISTVWNHPWRGKIFNVPCEKDDILRSFGIHDSPLIKNEMHFYLYVMMVYNALPKKLRVFLRSIYYWFYYKTYGKGNSSD
jgi:hypothetical protein